jgi:predicted Zn-dependent protease
MSARLAARCAALALLLGSLPARAERTTLLESTYDDAEAGRAGAVGVEQQVGILDDPALAAYVQSLGDKLLRAVPQRSFAYRFQVVDEAEPNAFALPGGYIFISRGLLAIAGNEDELACVIGHEIAHVAKRHAAAQQGATRGQSGLVSPFLRAGRSAAYARDLERTADRDGQILCAAAGYDPRGLATFLESLTRYERLHSGELRDPGYFDTHPLSRERSSIAFVQASELRWSRDASVGDPRDALLARTEGLPIGQRPESGMFMGSVFLHPDLGFKLRFPPRWRTANGGSVVGAQAPQGDAVVYLTADAQPGEVEAVARRWAEKGVPRDVAIRKSGPFRVGEVKAWQLDLLGGGPGQASVRSYVTFVPLRGAVWRITGAGLVGPNLESTLLTARSFRPINDEDRAILTSTRLRIVPAESGEDLAAVTKRTGSIWSVPEASVFNGGRSPTQLFQGGERVKIARSEPYAIAARRE